MKRYRKVSTIIWNDEKFRNFSDKGQIVFLFLMTHPHMTNLGAMRATLEGLAKEYGKWPLKAFAEAFREPLRKGMVEYDEKASFVGLPNFLRHNPPESPNVIRSWGKCWDDIPECLLKVQLAKRVKAFAEGLTEGFREAFESLPKDFRKTMPIQEQEQEQEQEQDLPPKSPKGDSGFDPLKADLPFPSPEFAAAWAEFCQHRVDIKVKLTKLAVTKILNRCRDWGELAAIASIDATVRSNKWTDIYEPRGTTAEPVKQRLATAEERENWRA